MLSCAVRIPTLSRQEWYAPLSRTNRLKSIELEADCLMETATQEALTRHGLSCLCAQDMLPPETIAFLTEHPNERDFLSIQDAILNSMLCAESADARVFPLDFRLDRLPRQPDERLVVPCAELLMRLLEAPLEAPFSLAVQVRQPAPFPTSLEMRRAQAICRQTGSARVGLYVHFHSDDFNAEGGSIAAFVEEHAERLKAICFHYDVTQAETLYDDEQAEWAQRLLDAHSDALVIFAPKTHGSEGLDRICRQALSWADYYHPTL